MEEGPYGERRDHREGARRPPARARKDDGGGPRGSVLGPEAQRSNKELLSAPMTREFIRSLTTKELIVVRDQGLCCHGYQQRVSLPAQEATETIRLYDMEAKNEVDNWQHGEGQMEGKYDDE